MSLTDLEGEVIQDMGTVETGHLPNNYFDDLNFFNTTLSEDIQSKFFNGNDSFTTEMGNHLLPDGVGSGSLGWSDVALVSLFCSIIAGTVAGNTLVIAAVITTRRLRTVTNCFVMSLAVADWLVGVFVMPPKVALYLANHNWKLGGFLCETWIALDILLCTASILSLCAISIDRYLAITRPLAYSRRRRSKRLALSMISCVWVAAAIITSPPIFGWYEENRNVENKCEYNENAGYVVYSALGSFFLPLLVMLYVYARIACVIARRQHSIQKLYNTSDKKSQCCGGSDAEEPLHQRDQERQASFERRGAAVNNPPIVGDEAEFLESSLEDRSRLNIPSGGVGTISDKRSVPGDKNTITKSTSGFWGRLRLKSCTSGDGDPESSTDNETKRSDGGGNDGQKAGAVSSDCDSNSASGIAISLPDPATLSGACSGNGGNGLTPSTGITDNPISRSACSSPRNLNQNPHHHHHLQCQSAQSHPSARLRTGSRLCHHSIATTSPQRNIHRVHQATSSTTRLFVDNELVPLEASKGLTLSKSTPRVWTVEETSSTVLGRGRVKSPNGRATSFKVEKNSRNSSRFIGNSATLTVQMNNSPAGNPASLMSSTNVASSPADVAPCDNTASSKSTSNRVYHPQANHYHNHHHNTSSNLNSVHRGRSMKLTLNLHGNDHNQNGSMLARDFASGRVASFKRETKTAQTLAAVVGGFIICWLPFFVAYVIGPFISSSMIPTALMDALIWLGWSNSTINPFIYAFYSPDFRSAFWRLTVRKCTNLFGNRRNADRRSPRRYDEHNNTHSRVST